MSTQNGSTSSEAGPSSRSSHLSTKIAHFTSSSPSRPFWSLEFFPPKTTQGTTNLLHRVARMNESLAPSWVNVTWGAGGSTQKRSLELAGRVSRGIFAEGSRSDQGDVLQHLLQLSQEPPSEDSPSRADCCLHLTCTNVSKSSLDETLQQAKLLGIRNILALRGDPSRGEEYWVAADTRFQLATDLVRYIKEEHGDWFCIGVAAYPEGPCDEMDKDEKRDIERLLLKQKAGAQFIITQLFYDTDVFIRWYKTCRAAGVTIPIIPGIMPIQNYGSFRRMTNLCKTSVPKSVLEALEPMRFDDAAVKAYGVNLCIQMISRIYLETDIRGFHFCTLNLEKSVRCVLEGLGWVDANGRQPADYGAVTKDAAQRYRDLSPSRPSLPPTTSSTSINGTVPKSSSNNLLIAALDPNNAAAAGSSSTSWDEFPNGRFGDARSPAFGEIDGYGVSLKVTPSEAIRLWGYPTKEQDVSWIFVKYLLGELSSIPWCDAPIFEETRAIQTWLLQLNLPGSASSSLRNKSLPSPLHSSALKGLTGRGYLTVGSQPAVDGLPSSNPIYGFGPKGGYVYQKAFVEFFCSEADKDKIKARVEAEDAKIAQGDNSGEHLTFFAGKRGVESVQSNLPSLSTPSSDVSPDEASTSTSTSAVEAVTWAIFPGSEIVQPTIIEVESFKAWRDEAFDLWLEWAEVVRQSRTSAASTTTTSPVEVEKMRNRSEKWLRTMPEEKWLVTVVHHDYKRPEALWEFLLRD